MTIIHDTMPATTPTPDPLLALLWGYIPAQPTLATAPVAATSRRA